MTAHQSSQLTSPPPEASLHEPESVHAGGVLIVIGALLLLALLTLFFVSRVFGKFAADPGLTDTDQTWKLQQTSPGVEPNQTYDRERLQSFEQAILEGYSWQDEEHQHAHIPIERAMKILAEKNLQIDWSHSQSEDANTENSDRVRPSTPANDQPQRENTQ